LALQLGNTPNGLLHAHLCKNTHVLVVHERKGLWGHVFVLESFYRNAGLGMNQFLYDLLNLSIL
jgi:hypothetical protein